MADLIEDISTSRLLSWSSEDLYDTWKEASKPETKQEEKVASVKKSDNKRATVKSVEPTLA